MPTWLRNLNFSPKLKTSEVTVNIVKLHTTGRWVLNLTPGPGVTLHEWILIFLYWPFGPLVVYLFGCMYCIYLTVFSYWVKDLKKEILTFIETVKTSRFVLYLFKAIYSYFLEFFTSLSFSSHQICNISRC